MDDHVSKAHRASAGAPGSATPPDHPAVQGICSRRGFLQRTAGAAVAGWVTAAALQGRTAFGKIGAGAAAEGPAGGPQNAGLHVVIVQSDHVVAGPVVHPVLIEEMLETAMRSLTGRDSMPACWSSVLDARDVIGLKFNSCGQEALATTPAVGRAIVRSLIASGWSPKQIVAVEGPEELTREYGLTEAVSGYERELAEFGSGTDQLARVLRQVTAIIDVPFLKSHNIAGLSCALKNLSHAFVKHPARYHANGCSPFVADIAALPQIQGKLRLCLVDGLRTVFRDGPEPTGSNVADTGMIMASRDPVATDAVALTLLNEIRERHRVAVVPRGPQGVRYLEPAEQRGLGSAVLHELNRKRIRM